MVVEELDVPLASIDMITGDAALTPDQGTTSGSFCVDVAMPNPNRTFADGRRWYVSENGRRSVRAGHVTAETGSYQHLIRSTGVCNVT
ncbi:MAG: hypothetical protein WA728_13870 [Xanthobacteraceae bacterium]